MNYGPALWVLTVLLLGRVIGQLVVFFYAPKFLPPMGQWQSGLVPYPLLVAVQAVVLGLMVSISYDFSRGSGFWVQPATGVGVGGSVVELHLLRRHGRPVHRTDDP